MGKGLQMALHNGALPWDAQSCPIPTSPTGLCRALGHTALPQPSPSRTGQNQQKRKQNRPKCGAGWDGDGHGQPRLPGQAALTAPLGRAGGKSLSSWKAELNGVNCRGPSVHPSLAVLPTCSAAEGEDGMGPLLPLCPPCINPAPAVGSRLQSTQIGAGTAPVLGVRCAGQRQRAAAGEGEAPQAAARGGSGDGSHGKTKRSFNLLLKQMLHSTN